MDVRTALQQGQTLLEEARSSAPRLTAEVLLMHAIGCERSWLYAHSGDELREVSWIRYGRYLHERLQGKPTQYITGHQEFYGREFRVTPDVLIPRPETEHLIEAALAHANAATRIIDVGTGSGAIAITLALETKARVFAADISIAALRVASENARALSAKLDFVACDLSGAFTPGAFDMVVSNPPYVPALDQSTIQREVRDYEPPVALYGGDDGLDVYRRLVPEARRLLKPGGWLMMELGYAVVDPVRAMLADWREVEVANDLAGLPRVVMARRA
ncbi:MAG TPA: peptide chain release factor N(5)-glutamine methyltransferase [Bryobacteraceae bacterium]|jgi:release factor glutamine methyltransferase|nr:peptide chain release factor N(5)-glutamine methyltransferase [Bryobacteraceae bacterium]